MALAPVTRSYCSNETFWCYVRYNLSNYTILIILFFKLHSNFTCYIILIIPMKKPIPGCWPASSEWSGSKSCWQTFAKTLAWSNRSHKEYRRWPFLWSQERLPLNRFLLKLMPQKVLYVPLIEQNNWFDQTGIGGNGGDWLDWTPENIFLCQ